MTINMAQIYAQLEAWRNERKITAESQKEGYLVNVMEELGELAGALRCYEQIKEFLNKNKGGMCGYQHHKHSLMLIEAEHEIIDALCDIAVFTINAGADIPTPVKRTEIEFKKSSLNADYILKQMVEKCVQFSYFEWGEASAFNIILINCAYLCEHYGFNFEIAMLETIKEISSRTGSYNEATKKWEKDMSNEAQAKWYQANYDLARI
ncbi:MAG: hypothetical protein SO144_04625 [Campylobacter sp.]|nr:hypothetical protein [Campylobacter sp.]